jgi:hypothetical protein
LTAELSSARQKTEELQSQYADLKQASTAEQERLRADRRRLRSRLDAMEQSRSWRLTQPLRAPYQIAVRMAQSGVPPLPLVKDGLRKVRELMRQADVRTSTLTGTLKQQKKKPRTVPAPDLAALQREYEASGLSKEEDRFVLYRIIGNDLPPRHAEGQTLGNVRFILENEPELEGCEKRWVLNRIAKPKQEEALRSLLEAHGQAYLSIPFDMEEYARVGLDHDPFPPGFFLSPEFEQLGPDQRSRATTQAYRLKNNYVMHNNGARNAALEDGRGRAKWVLPWDGNCYVTKEAWQEISSAVKREPFLKYYVVPMARTMNNDELLHPTTRPEAAEEPQILFRRDAAESFEDARPYGRRPKVGLLWRLGVPGPWDRWRFDPWDMPEPELSPEAGQFGQAGWVARLASGVSRLERSHRNSIKERGDARDHAIQATCRRLDERIVAERLHSAGTLTYDALALERLKQDAGDDALARLRIELLEQAEAALECGPYSVTDKTTQAPSHDAHDYWHPAPYWWPNPRTRDGLPYVRRDGERAPGTQLYEPGSEKFDRTRLQRLFDDATTLALAATATGEARYAEHAMTLVRTWFLDPPTRMNPHLRFAQVRLGHDGNEGQNTGVIELKDLYYFLDALRLLDGARAISGTETEGVKEWLREYLGWLQSSRQGQRELRMPNNHGTAYDLQVASIAAYLGDVSLVRSTLERSAHRIGQQFAADGSQPHEMERTSTAHYTCFNAQTWINLARLAERCGPDLWGIELADGRGLRRGLEWLIRELSRDEWAFKQIGEFDRRRGLPIVATYREVYGGADHGDWYDPEDDPVCFFPHDGIPPYWRLCLPPGR